MVSAAKKHKWSCWTLLNWLLQSQKNMKQCQSTWERTSGLKPCWEAWPQQRCCEESCEAIGSPVQSWRPAFCHLWRQRWHSSPKWQHVQFHAASSHHQRIAMSLGSRVRSWQQTSWLHHLRRFLPDSQFYYRKYMDASRILVIEQDHVCCTKSLRGLAGWYIPRWHNFAHKFIHQFPGGWVHFLQGSMHPNIPSWTYSQDLNTLGNWFDLNCSLAYWFSRSGSFLTCCKHIRTWWGTQPNLGQNWWNHKMKKRQRTQPPASAQGQSELFAWSLQRRPSICLATPSHSANW